MCCTVPQYSILRLISVGSILESRTLQCVRENVLSRDLTNLLECVVLEAKEAEKLITRIGECLPGKVTASRTSVAPAMIFIRSQTFHHALSLFGNHFQSHTTGHSAGHDSCVGLRGQNRAHQPFLLSKANGL